MAFLSTTRNNLNTNNQGATTSSIDVTSQTMFAWKVIDRSGSHDNHKVGLQVSFDNNTWIAAGIRLEGIDVFSEERDFPYGYIRFRVAVAEGSASKVDIEVNAK